MTKAPRPAPGSRRLHFLQKYRIPILVVLAVAWLTLAVAAALLYESAPLLTGLLTGILGGAILGAIGLSAILQRRGFRRIQQRDRKAAHSTAKSLGALQRALNANRGELRKLISASRSEAKETRLIQQKQFDALTTRIDTVAKTLETALNNHTGTQERATTALLLRADDLRQEIEILQNIATAKQREMLADVLEQTLTVNDKLKAVARTISLERRRAYVDIEALVSLHRTLPIRYPLPSLGDWAVSPETGLYTVESILRLKPQHIVEAGSGVSTVLFAYAAELNDEAVVYALEHDEEYAEMTSRLLELHGLERRARVIHAPLVDVTRGEDELRWYDLSDLRLPKKIDLLFVDGPPAKTGALARYPALPLLWDSLNPGATILLDDAARPDEQAAVARWMAEFPLTKEYIAHERGTVRLTVPL